MSKHIVLSSGHSSCAITPARGGLVTSLNLSGKEVLWLPETFSPNETSWPGGGIPICFPFAGRVWHQEELHHYGLQGKSYPMPLHGFAFAESWNELKITKNEATIELTDNDRTRAVYPFSFRTTLTLTMGDIGLRIAFEIEHKKALSNAAAMPVALGFHPYFNLDDAARSTLELGAEKYYPVTPAGAAGKVASAADLGAKPWNVHNPLLGSLILSQLTRSQAILDNGSSQIKMNFGPETIFQHIVVWTNRPNDFYCVEPWMSLPDAPANASGCKWLKNGEQLNGFVELSLLNHST